MSNRKFIIISILKNTKYRDFDQNRTIWVLSLYGWSTNLFLYWSSLLQRSRSHNAFCSKDLYHLLVPNVKTDLENRALSSAASSGPELFSLSMEAEGLILFFIFCVLKKPGGSSFQCFHILKINKFKFFTVFFRTYNHFDHLFCWLSRIFSSHTFFLLAQLSEKKCCSLNQGWWNQTYYWYGSSSGARRLWA